VNLSLEIGYELMERIDPFELGQNGFQREQAPRPAYPASFPFGIFKQFVSRYHPVSPAANIPGSNHTCWLAIDKGGQRRR
jgi:hypothetical protein